MKGVSTMNEMMKLKEMLVEANIAHTCVNLDKRLFGPNAMQIRIYKDDTLQKELDDVVFHKGSYGYEQGLLETCRLGDCSGYETAEEVFNGWMKIFFKPIKRNKKKRKTC